MVFIRYPKSPFGGGIRRMHSLPGRDQESIYYSTALLRNRSVSGLGFQGCPRQLTSNALTTSKGQYHFG